jgi:hypothetical protein
MTKEEMVHKLVAHSVQAALAESKRYWLSDLFERGFAGYRNFSTDQLRRELQMRGITASGEEAADDDLDDDIDWDGSEWDDSAASALDLDLEFDRE